MRIIHAPVKNKKACLANFFRVDRRLSVVHCAAMKTPHDIIYALGVREVAAALGRHPGRVRQASLENRLPASWFDVIDTMCKRRRIKLSRDLFKWEQRG